MYPGCEQIEFLSALNVQNVDVCLYLFVVS